VLRRRVKEGLAAASSDDDGQQKLSFIEVGANAEVYEYTVLVTSLGEELSAFGQLCRDRGDSENIFDELKNQWGVGSRNAIRSGSLRAASPRMTSPVAGWRRTELVDIDKILGAAVQENRPLTPPPSRRCRTAGRLSCGSPEFVNRSDRRAAIGRRPPWRIE
jgi:hypothetical protein